LFACSDNDGLIPVVNEPDPIAGEARELIPISFNVDFFRETTPLRSSSSSDFTAKYLDYAVFDNSTGLFYKDGHYVDSDGAINEELPEGEYTFVFVANNTQQVTIGPNGSNIYAHVYANASFSAGSVDQFYTKFTYTVERENENINLPITLQRIVGKIEIVLTDVTLENAPYIRIASDNIPYPRYYFSTTIDWTQPWRLPGQIEVLWQDFYRPTHIAGEFIISLYLFENINKSQERFPVSIQIVASTVLGSYPSQDPATIIATKAITDVEILKNKIVRYTGKLFDGPDPDPDQPSSFTITVNDSWGETIDETF
jgi:hypothetical protein